MKTIWAASLAVLMLGCMLNAAETAPSPVVGGYYEVGGNYERYPWTRINSGYNIIYNSFLTSDANNEFTFQPNPGVVKYGHEQGKLVLISLGGGGFGMFVELTNTPEKSEAYADKVVKHVAEHDYDGIDVDWEHPTTPVHGAQWSALMKSLRVKLDALGKQKGRKMYLTTALPPGNWSYKHNDYAVMRDCLDYLNVMAYDLGWGTSNYHAPMYANPVDPQKVSTLSQLEFLEKEVKFPRSKTIIGLPFYGNYFEIDRPFVKVDSKKWRQIWYREALQLSEGFKREYDPKSGGVWSWSPDHKKLVIYDSPQSIYDKTREYLKLGYGGVFCWAVDRDILPDDSQPLTDAMMKAVKDFTAKAKK